MSKKHPNSLGRQEKLKSRKQIDILFTNRQFFTQPPIRMFYHIEKRLEASTTASYLSDDKYSPDSLTAGNATSSRLKAGFSASKRYFKHASKRNRVKRLMREVYRNHKQSLVALAEKQGYLISLFFLYGHKELPTYDQIEKCLLPLLNKLEGKVNAA